MTTTEHEADAGDEVQQSGHWRMFCVICGEWHSWIEGKMRQTPGKDTIRFVCFGCQEKR